MEPSPQDSRVITVVLSHEKGDVTLGTEAEVDIDKEGFRQGRQCRTTFEKYVQPRQTGRRETDRQDGHYRQSAGTEPHMVGTRTENKIPDRTVR